MLRQEMF